MPHQILLNDQPLQFAVTDLPMLITYRPKMGGSLFSVCVIADLFRRGASVLFLSAYPMAREEFLQQLAGHDGEIVTCDTRADIRLNAEKRAIMLRTTDPELFRDALHVLPDVRQRVIFLKNMEALDDRIIAEGLELSTVVFSGDLDETRLRGQVAKKTFRTIIAFSQPRTNLTVSIPSLERYTGYLQGVGRRGTVRMHMAPDV